MSYKADQINALKRFKEAYYGLSVMWGHKDNNLNNTDAIKHYPFHKSFDELDVPGWVDVTINELRAETDNTGPYLPAEHIYNMLKIIREKKDDIGSVSVEDVEKLYTSLKCLAYANEVKNFYNFLEKSMPDLPNDTPENQDAFDEAWDKFYSTKFTIGFGGKFITIENEATIYNGILDTLKELIDYCL